MRINYRAVGLSITIINKTLDKFYFLRKGGVIVSAKAFSFSFIYFLIREVPNEIY